MSTIRFSGIAGIPLLASLLTLPAQASHPEPAADDGYYAYADVIEVVPRYGWHEITEPVTRCVSVVDDHDYPSSWRVRDDHRYDYDDRHRDADRYGRNEGSAAAGIVGGLIGGLIGHQFGGGDGKTALTVIGAMLGASMARDHVRRDQYDHRRGDDAAYTQSVRQCTESERTRRVRGVDGYDVTYRYQDTEFHKWMHEHPGEFVRVHVAVEPLATE